MMSIPNNPLWDAQLAEKLFYDEIVQFHQLPAALQSIYYRLLAQTPVFKGFFEVINYQSRHPREHLIVQLQTYFKDQVCLHADYADLIGRDPVAFAYALALITTRDPESVTPPWLVKSYPALTSILYALKVRRCKDPACGYCREWLDPYRALETFFGYSQFRKFDPSEEVSLQEQVVRASLDNQSLVAIFPTGGGKSLTFQLPALMIGRATRALTVVISPLQSLMKDQVDILARRHEIAKAVTINGLLSPLERSRALERVMEGDVHLLYISPESLRSRTITALLKNRSIARIVIDEAHCFSAWGQDFRVDYLYIGEFIAQLQREKQLAEPIPVSCFTATAKPRVVQDIQAYFQAKLSLPLQVFKASSRRVNLTYTVQEAKGKATKYQQLKRLLVRTEGPRIIYVSRVRTAEMLAHDLTQDGFKALAYHGQMDSSQKIHHQDQFMNNEVDTIVATAAFGMGVDKHNVAMVVHYEIPDSLENYVQEAGRAGRSEDIQANCLVLFDEDDLNKHFNLLNQTRLTKKEVDQIWRGIKQLTGQRPQITRSALEIAKAAGWDREMHQLETRVTAALAALEDGGYLKRGHNAPRIFANSFKQRDINVANEMVRQSPAFSAKDQEHAIRIIQRIIKEDETRVDYLSEVLGIRKDDVLRVLNLLRQENIIGDAKDLTAFIDLSAALHPVRRVKKYARLEQKLLILLAAQRPAVFLKEINETLIADGVTDSSLDAIKDVLLYWETRSYIYKTRTDQALHAYQIGFRVPPEKLLIRAGQRLRLGAWIAGYLAAKWEREETGTVEAKARLLEFSVLELKNAFEKQPGLYGELPEIPEYEEALLYLNAIGAIKLEGGFLILYNPFTIERLEKNNARQYTKAAYQKLETHYGHKIQQIHIVGEYARKMLSNYQDALTFVEDYFTLEYEPFLQKYFPARQGEIKRALTPAKFKELFGSLSTEQLAIIKDNVNEKVLITAGPGSGKTKVLVHKVASLLLLEDVRPEQFLMLTFSRAAAMEFKDRLRHLVGNLVYYVDIHTYHSYCFNLLGRVGSLEKSDGIISACLQAIATGTLSTEKIAAKSVLVVDEFQDINQEEYRLLEKIMELAGEIRVIAVGDDNQNIYEFRGSSAGYMSYFAEHYGAKRYDLVTNFRSRQNLVAFTNGFLSTIGSRLPKAGIVAATTQNGTIRLVRHRSAHLIDPLVQNLKRLGLTGTTAVLTPTNEEAMLTENWLRKNGIAARLILSNEGFYLGDLLEIRHFSDSILPKEEAGSGIIPDATWEEAKSANRAAFAHSDKLWLSQAVVSQFEKAYPRKYLSEWKSYMREITFEDFYYPEQNVVLVSTMHKAKGKEFDNVFLLLDGFAVKDDAARRVVYVALTRARQNLIIHTNQSLFNSCHAENLEIVDSGETYPEVNEICLHATHRDVYLNEFKRNRVNVAVDRLLAGEKLLPGAGSDSLLTRDHQAVLKYSRSFAEKLARKGQEGYQLTDAEVNFIVYWRDQENGSTYKIVLPRIMLIKQ